MKGKYKKIEVIWEDSTSWGNWHSLEEAKKRETIIISTVGYLIYKNRKRVVVVGSIDDKECPDCSDQVLIPRQAIKSIKELCERQA